ncbi:type II toxin-antitoxin system PemK/MazF family toxin [Amycolatopsis sp. NPDC089917]|uniref:type II toxin-antitoxin system PemK/MazF family toxin n=1 Tax=Amycolatopsis sp. NPDC089917 TaxID=3155187 RepID=UPI003444B4D3
MSSRFLRMKPSLWPSLTLELEPRFGLNTDRLDVPYPTDPPRRGEIYNVDFSPGRGSEQLGVRPAVVISLDSFNKSMPVVCVAAITSKIKPALRVTTLLPQGDPLRLESQILAFQLMTIDKGRLKNYLGSLRASQLEDLKGKLRTSWGL